MGVISTPAFAGANFDGNGGCLRHPDVRLTQKMFTDDGKVVYKELMRRCPKCNTKQQQPQPEKAPPDSSSYATKSQHQQGSVGNRSNSRSSSFRRGNSKSTIEVTTPTTSESSNDNPLARSSSRSRSRARSKSRERDTTHQPKSPPQTRSVSKPRQSVWGQVPSQRDNSIRPKKGGSGEGGSITSRENSSNNNHVMPKKVFDSPFDPKGRCHYHPNISLAKKKLTGGWKVLLEACPRCVEERYIQENNNSSDNRSVGSRRSTKSDNRSVSSRHSTRSDNSRHSNKSHHRSSSVATTSRVASSSSSAVRLPSAPRSGGGKKSSNSAEKSTMARYECPFDNQGCCRIHHHVRLAKKKLTGGWKVIQDVCPECDEEDNCSADSRTSRYSRKSVASRGSQKPEGNNYNRSSSTSKSKSSVSGIGNNSSGRRHSSSSRVVEGGVRNNVEHSVPQSDQIRTKLERMHVTADANRDDGVRRGKSIREKANKMDGTCREKPPSKSSYTNETSSSNANRGSNENDRGVSSTPKQRSSKEDTAQYRQRALKEYKDLYESAKVVKNMMFIDVHGDAGRYTGDVNEFRMPHGQGNIIYEHGLVQGGKWTNGVLDEGSMSSGGKSLSESKTSLSNTNRGVGARSIDP